MPDRICELFVRIAERFGEVHNCPLPKSVLSLGDSDTGWCVRLNPTDAESDGVPAFTAMVSHNGWPAGVVDPQGGIIAAGDVANEATFRAWLKDAKAVQHA